MTKFADWIIETWEFDERTRTGRWIAWRHPDGGRNVARFRCFGTLKRFVKRHAIGLGRKVRAYNAPKLEWRDVVTT